MLAEFSQPFNEGDVTSFHVPEDPEDMFAMQCGNYAAITPYKDLLSKKPEGLTVDGAAGKEVDSKDVVVFANFKAIRAKVLPMLNDGRTKIMDEFDKNIANVHFRVVA